MQLFDSAKQNGFLKIVGLLICAATAVPPAHADEYEQNSLLLIQQCAPAVHQDTMRRIVKTESSFNPFAIGVVGGHLERQPRNREEAIVTAQWLEDNGFNYSVGLSQLNKYNFKKYGLTLHTAFEECKNLKAGSDVLKDCFEHAKKVKGNEQDALRDAFSCYESGNFKTGYKDGYVQKIVGDAVTTKGSPIKVIVKKKKIVAESKSPSKTADTVEAANTSKSALLF